MLKFLIRGDTRTLVGLGLTEGNVELLRHDSPVLVKLDVLGITPGHDKPIDVLIVLGENEAAIVEMVKTKLGFGVGPNTRVDVDAESLESSYGNRTLEEEITMAILLIKKTDLKLAAAWMEKMNGA